MYEEITPRALAERRANGELWQLLDVREDWERDIVRVADTIDIPMQELPARRHELSEGAPIAVLCHSGGRSARVAAWLVSEGFERVANVSGGIDAWSVQVDSRLARY